MTRLFLPLLILLAGCTDAPSTEANHPVDPSLCQFSKGACTVGTVALTLVPAHAPSEQPLDLALALPEGHQVINARIEGRDMFMGIIPVRFSPQGQAEVIYGSCSSNYMVWRLFVTIEDDKGEQYSRVFDWLADAD